METARLFVGLPLPGGHKRELSRLLGELKPLAPCSCAWTLPDTWHLTLKFLGDTPLKRIDAVKQALALVAWDPFTFRPGGGGAFPGAERPRVLWVGAAEGGAACRELSRKVDEALAGIGIEPQSRPFAAHLTVARVKAARRDGSWDRLFQALVRHQWPSTVMDRFVLWRSYAGGVRRPGTPGGLPGPLHVPLGEFGAAGGTA